jgi:hypothetical protein
MLLAQIARDKAAAEARGEVVEDVPEATVMQRGDDEEEKVEFKLALSKPVSNVVKATPAISMVS